MKTLEILIEILEDVYPDISTITCLCSKIFPSPKNDNIPDTSVLSDMISRFPCLMHALAMSFKFPQLYTKL